MTPAAGAGIEYVLPIRCDSGEDLAELTGYLMTVSTVAEVTVVDGSAPAAFARHERAWSALFRHLPPDPWPGRNRKVAGVVTGVFRARHERVVIADDDVRYRPEQIRMIAGLLEGADLVRPQNVFRPLPWHARWDTARILLNRAFGSDYPGTFAVRAGLFRAMGGYDGDVLFENLQLMRSIRAAGGRVLDAPGLYVARRPPDTRRFLEQRVRQAYDDFAQPVRLVGEASLLPMLVAGIATGRGWLPASVAAALACGLAEIGRRRAGGTAEFPASSAWWAPAWVLERAICVWLAVGQRLRGGVRYRGSRIPAAARPPSARFARSREGHRTGPVQILRGEGAG